MNEFDEVIQATREAFEPTPSDRERNRQRLAASAAGAAVAGSLVAKSSSAAALLAGHSLGGLAKLFFASMACTLVGASAVVAITRVAAKAPADATRSAPVLTAAQAAPPLNPTPQLPIVPAKPAPSEPATFAAAAPSHKDEDTARRPIASSAASAPAPSAELDAELASLRLARQASASGDHERAEHLLDQLDQQHPHGLLLEERAALRAVTVCEAGETPRAHALANDFLRLHPRSVYAAKVRRACRLAAVPAASPSGGASATFTDPPEPGH